MSVCLPFSLALVIASLSNCCTFWLSFSGTSLPMLLLLFFTTSFTLLTTIRLSLIIYHQFLYSFFVYIFYVESIVLGNI